MVLKNNIKKEEALKLREGGMKLTEIVTKTGLSKATLKRFFKKKGLVNDKLSLSHNKSAPSENKDKREDKNESLTIKSEMNDENVNPKTEVGGGTFTGTSVTFDIKTGSLSLEDTKNVMEEPKSTEKDDKRVTSESHNVAGLGQEFKTAPETRKPDIDAPENVLDKFFLRGTTEILVPLGLLVAGFMMSDKKGSKTEFREDRGDNW